MSKLPTVRILRTLALSIFAVAMAHAATVDVSVDVTSISGGLFQYDYTVADPTGELFDLDIAVPLGITVSGLAAPGGNDASSAFNVVNDSDSAIQFVSFVENLGTFTATPESGFIFDSPTGPGATTFDANLITDSGIVVQTGSTTGPVQAATPEPSSLAVCAAAGVALAFGRKKWLARRPQ
jgi:hypothetical protein